MKDGFELADDNSIKANPFLQTSDKDVYAAGDVCTFPFWYTGENTRIEHYINALDQGSYAAFNMLGKMVPYSNIPFFWTRNYNKGLQYAGYTKGYDKIHIDGDVMEGKFLALYIKNN